MIKNQSQCPYCNACAVAYDWDADKIIFNPDLAKQEPCEHVAYIGVYSNTRGEWLSDRHTIWPPAVAADESFAEYLRGIATGTAAPDASYTLVDAEHVHHHKDGIVDVTFRGIYSPDPKEFLRVCRDDHARRRRL